MNFGINKPDQSTREDDQMAIFKEEEKGAKWCVGSVHGKRETLGNTYSTCW